MNKLQRDPKELEALQDGVIDFVQKILKQRNQLIDENKKLREKREEEREYYEKMLSMKEEKIEILKMKLDLVRREIKTEVNEVPSLIKNSWLLNSRISHKGSKEEKFKKSRASLRHIVDMAKNKPKRDTVRRDGEIKKIPICMDNIAKTLQRIRKSYSKDRGAKVKTSGYLTKLHSINRLKTTASIQMSKKERRSLYKKSERLESKENQCNKSTHTFHSRTQGNFDLSKSLRREQRLSKRPPVVSPSGFDSRTNSFGRMSLHGRSNISLMSKNKCNKTVGKSRKGRGGCDIFVKKPVMRNVRPKNDENRSNRCVEALRESFDKISLNGFTDHFRSCIKSKITC